MTTKQARDLSTVDVSPRPDGSFGVLSSRGDEIYTVKLSAEGNTCNCPAGRNDRRCYHVAAVCARYVNVPRTTTRVGRQPADPFEGLV